MKNMHKMIVMMMVTLLAATGCPSSQTTDDEEPTEEPGVEEEIEEEAEEVEEEVEDTVEDADERVDEELDEMADSATAEVHNADGEHLGDIMFSTTEEGVLVEGRLEGLEPGTSGFHVHENGLCEPPTFESAGGHFNPQGHPHGAPDDPREERHAGDFGNIEITEDGVAEIYFVDDTITLGRGVNDIGGHALIVHEEQDDLESQPTGDAGPRAACGIVELNL